MLACHLLIKLGHMNLVGTLTGLALFLLFLPLASWLIRRLR